MGYRRTYVLNKFCIPESVPKNVNSPHICILVSKSTHLKVNTAISAKQLFSNSKYTPTSKKRDKGHLNREGVRFMKNDFEYCIGNYTQSLVFIKRKIARKLKI